MLLSARRSSRRQEEEGEEQRAPPGRANAKRSSSAISVSPRRLHSSFLISHSKLIVLDILETCAAVLLVENAPNLPGLDVVSISSKRFAVFRQMVRGQCVYTFVLDTFVQSDASVPGEELGLRLQRPRLRRQSRFTNDC